MSEAAKLARKEYMRQYRQSNKEKINEQHKTWRENNPDKIKQYQENYWTKKGQEMLGQA